MKTDSPNPRPLVPIAISVDQCETLYNYFF